MARPGLNKKVIRLSSRGGRVRIVKSNSTKCQKKPKTTEVAVAVDDDSGRGLAYTAGETWRK